MDLKKYLPFESYVLTTQLSPQEVYKRLSDNIEPRKMYRFFTFDKQPTKPYEGEIAVHSFRISRVINYRNSFLPIINGEILSFFGQTQIQIKMKPAIFVLIFMSFWLSMTGAACVGILFNIPQMTQSGFSPMLLIPFAMFIFGCLLSFFSFKIESKKSKAFLATLLMGREDV